MPAVHTKVNMVALTPEQTARFRRFAFKHGRMKAKARIGVADVTFDNAMEYGLMRSSTRDKVLASLQREEEKDAGDAGSTSQGEQEALHSQAEAGGGLLRRQGTEEAGGGEGQ